MCPQPSSVDRRHCAATHPKPLSDYARRFSCSQKAPNLMNIVLGQFCPVVFASLAASIRIDPTARKCISDIVLRGAKVQVRWVDAVLVVACVAGKKVCRYVSMYQHHDRTIRVDHLFDAIPVEAATAVLVHKTGPWPALVIPSFLKLVFDSIRGRRGWKACGVSAAGIGGVLAGWIFHVLHFVSFIKARQA